MSTTVIVSGQSFTIPADGDYNWGTSVSNLLIKLATSTAVLQSTSTTFSLSGGDLDFGANYSIKSLSYKSRAANPSSTGIVRLGNTESVAWRNAANNADLALSVNASNQLLYNSNQLLDSAGSGLTGLIVDSMVNASAGIAYSKLSLANSIANADISSSAAIAYSKLNLSGSIVNADINASAAIALSKLAALTTGKVLQSNASTGAIEASSVTNTTLSYLDATSSIQNQLNAKAPLNSPTLVTPALGVATATSLAMGEALNASSILDVASTTKGFLEPRMTQAQRDAISSPATGLQIYNTDSNKLNFYNGTSWSEVGSGSSGINYITDYDGSAIGSWTTYADAAASSPVDGTGGSPSSTYAVSSDSSIRGTSNFLWTHSAANRQGEGFSYNFTINPADKGKVLQCSFEYLIASGTYSDDDLQFWIYDVTNSTLIQPAPYKLKNSSIVEKFAFEFQTASNSTSYRLIGHVATSTATAYTIRFDNWNLGPQAKLYGSPITDAVAYTPTFTGFGTVTNINVKSQRIGDSLRVFGYFQTGTNTATTALMTLGFGGVNANVNIDTNKIGDTVIIGSAASTETASATYFLTAPLSGTTNAVKWGRQTSTATVTAAANGNAWSNNAYISFDLIVPIQGWGSSQVMSNDADTRVVAARATKGASDQTGVNPNNSYVKITFPSLSGGYDKTGGYDTANSKYTVQVPGVYTIDAKAVVNATNVLANEYDLAVYKNGSIIATLDAKVVAATTFFALKGSVDLDLVAGDYIEIYLYGAGNNSASTLTVSGATANTFVSFKRVSGPSQIAASESVSALYNGAPPTGTLTSAYNTTTFGTKRKDSHNAYSGGTYTVPVSGTYSIAAQTRHDATYAAGNTAGIALFINGVQFETGLENAGGVEVSLWPLLSVHSVPLLAGDLVTIRSYDNGTSPVFVSNVNQNFFSIVRTGNY